MGHLKAVSVQKQHIKPTEDFTKTEKVVSMAEFKKTILEDEIVEVNIFNIKKIFILKFSSIVNFLNKQMGMFHEAYLQFKDELSTAVKDPICLNSYINSNFKELIW